MSPRRRQLQHPRAAVETSPHVIGLSVPGAAAGARGRRHASPRSPTTSSTPRKRARIAAGNPLSFLHVTRVGDRSARRRPIRTTRASTTQAVQNLEALKREAPLVIEDAPSLYFYRLKMGAHEQTGLAGVLLGRRVRPRPDQEAREDAQGQGRRSHAASARTARADRRRVPDLPRLGGDRRPRAPRVRRRAALRPHRAATASSTRSGACRRR